MTASLKTLGPGRDAGLYYIDDPNREARSKSRDEYYVRDGGGVWWSSGETIVRHAAAIDAETFRDLCAGLDPATGTALVRGSGDGHRAGWDLTFSAPKSLSVLWAAGDETQRVELEAAHRHAVAGALTFVVAEHLVSVRRGAGGIIRERAADLIVAEFDHFTSREGDPNIHSHCVLMNVAGRQDGGHGALEPEKLFVWQKVVGAAYRAGLAERLRGLGFDLREAGRDQIEIRGMPQSVIEAFSKRSHQIEAMVGREASGAQKEMAALATRGAKREIPIGEQLEARWRSEFTQLRIDPWVAVRETPRTPEPTPAPEVLLDVPEVPGPGPVARAASTLYRHENVIDRKALLERALIEASLTGVGIDAIDAEIRTFEDQGVLVRLEGQERGEAWTTPAIAAAEAALLRSADRPEERVWFRDDAVNQALAAAAHLSAEQHAAVQFSAGRDGVAVIEAGAGTGKTTLARAVVDAATRSGLRVIGLASSWVAADELAQSTGLEAAAIAKWRHDRANGAGLQLDERTVVLVDEAGMAGTRDLATVLAAARDAGAKVILFGDRRQLESVSGGGALRAVTEVLARQAVLVQVRRQEVDWQRAASIAMARGDSEAGLRAYAASGLLDLVAGEEAARARTIEVCMARTF
jgi:conjugative relaxase-like TrwC/TraI family protein